jgi:tetratricopeptide (TPR) repeat protein
MGVAKTFAFIIASVLFFLVGCSSTPSTIVKKSDAELKDMEAHSWTATVAFREGRYKDAEKTLLELTRENTVSRSLYLAELGAVYIAQGRELEARKTLMQAQAHVELFFDSESEKEAASLFGGELNKVYKGDPYERSSLYMLLALLFLNEGDIDNALACCKSGLLHDADSAGVIYSSDYAMLQFLAALCYKIRGNSEDADRMSKVAFKAHLNQPESPLGAKEALSGDFNTLLVFWVGFGPSFSAIGEYGEKRMISPGFSASDSFAVVYEDTYIDSYLGLGDVSFQAITRGGRLMDNILDQKAALKHGTKVAGNALLAAGLASLPSVAASPIIMGPVALGLIATGGIAHGIGYTMNPEADIRHWKNLPDEFILVPINLPPGKNKLRVLAFKHSEFIESSSFTVEINPAIPINICQIILNDIGSNSQESHQKKLLDYPLIFTQLILKEGCSAVFTEAQVKQGTAKLYKKYKVKDGVWPKKILYNVTQHNNYPATERLNAWISNYTNFCKAMLQSREDAKK